MVHVCLSVILVYTYFAVWFCGPDFGSDCTRTWPRGYKTFFMLNSAEHEIYSAHKC